MHSDRHLAIALALLRLAIAAFLLVWSVDKIVNVKGAQAVFANFYFWKDASPTALMAIGVLQTIVVVVFAMGALKPWSYGAVLVMHGVATIASLGRMIPPYGPGANKLFWAAVPVLAAMLVLFVLRERDTLVSLGGTSKR
jgi:hypothetical protein